MATNALPSAQEFPPETARPMISLRELTAAEAARKLAAGEMRALDYVQDLLRAVDERESEIQAFAHLDPAYVIEQAKRLDQLRETGRPTGPLHGVPVGIKDIIDTADMPTEYGTPLFAGRRPGRDATVVRLLREAGAIIMGKTVTTELAVMHPGKTRNPHNPAHTPGGSSSGSAAAVAAHMLPLALGTQTNGSVIRPAAFCGVYGFKPSFGLISRVGILEESPPLDTVGIFARSIEDVALITDVLIPYDAKDKGMWERSRAPLSPVAMAEPPLPPNIAFVRTPVWDQAEETTRQAFAELTETLGERCGEIVLPGDFNHVVAMHRAIMFADIARNYGEFYDRGKEVLSASLQAIIEEGRTVLALHYNAARQAQDLLEAQLDAVFDHYDAIITPAAPGPAPHGLETTGNPVFCTLWTFLGMPAISLPLLEIDGLPVGVQLVGQKRNDARLLRTARWLVRFLQDVA